jgi:type II secretory pathway predicted ATPase ExeA
MLSATKPSQNALQFFGFRYPPFSDTFEITTPYQSNDDTVMLDRIDALLRQGKSVALCGEAGTGKSMLVKAITARLDSKEYRIAQIPYGGLQPSALLRDLCDELDIDTSGRKNLLSRISADFSRASDRPFPVIIIDEAHEMQYRSVIDLCSLLHDKRKRTAAAALILVGLPVLRKKLELDINASIRSRHTSIFTMQKLSIDSAVEFLRYRLSLVKASNIFTDEALQCLATDTKGNRRTLMNLATLCLEEAARRSEKLITDEIVTAITLEYNR